MLPRLARPRLHTSPSCASFRASTRPPSCLAFTALVALLGGCIGDAVGSDPGDSTSTLSSGTGCSQTSLSTTCDSDGMGTGGTDTASGPDGKCPVLPDTIDEDRSAGPGCVRLERTLIDGATLTIAPGTRVVVANGGFLAASAYGDNGALRALGTKEEPIVFTSAEKEPKPGDWQCVHLGRGASGSELRHVTIEYAGQPCDANGATDDGALFVNAPIRELTHVTIQDSANYGLWLDTNALVRELHDNTFSRNEKASVRISTAAIPGFTGPNTFEDDDDVIEVSGSFSLDSDGTWHRQAVPYRTRGKVTLGNNAAVTIEPGTIIEMVGSSFEVFAAYLEAKGTAAQPITFRSGRATPKAGDWGCLLFSYVDTPPVLEHVIIEHAGNGEDCSGATYKAALVGPAAMTAENCEFREIAGDAINLNECDAANAFCANTFDASVSGEAIVCGYTRMPVACG